MIGGPGVGKTFVANLVIEKYKIERKKYDVIEDPKHSVLICAPTGVAANY